MYTRRRMQGMQLDAFFSGRNENMQKNGFDEAKTK